MSIGIYRFGGDLSSKGGREIRPRAHRIVFGTQVIRQIYIFRATPILFGATHVELRTSKSEAQDKCFMSFLS